MRTPLTALEATIARAFGHAHVPADRASVAAWAHAGPSSDGAASHGLGHVAAFVSMLRAGTIRPDAAPRRVRAPGALEVRAGRLGHGLIDALHATDRAAVLAAELRSVLAGMQHVPLVRGAPYGWRAAPSGFVLIASTSAGGDMPPWGSAEKRIGHHPFVMAAPRADCHLVLDMTMSQYSHGALETTRRR